jgi:hypothetical protein
MCEYTMPHKELKFENTLHELAPKKARVKGQYIRLMNLGTSVGIVIRLRAGQWRNSGSMLGSIGRIFYFLKRPGQLSGQPPNLPFNRWGSKAAIGVNLTTTVYLEPRLGMSGAVSSLPHMPSWCPLRFLLRITLMLGLLLFWPRIPNKLTRIFVCTSLFTVTDTDGYSKSIPLSSV